LREENFPAGTRINPQIPSILSRAFFALLR